MRRLGCFVTGLVCLELIQWNSLPLQHCNLEAGEGKIGENVSTVNGDKYQHINLLGLPFCFNPLGGLAGAAFTPATPAFPLFPTIRPTAPGVELAELGGPCDAAGATLCPGTRPNMLLPREMWAELEPSKLSPDPAPLVVIPLELELEMELLLSGKTLD